MLRKTSYYLIAILLLVFTSSAFAQTGSIKGKIYDKESNIPLPGAKIQVENTSRGAVSKNTGDFTIIEVPAGTQKLLISYIGYKNITQEVTVKDGETSTIDIMLEPQDVKSGEITVTGEWMRGQARALNTQKNKINVTNIVAADQIGRFPDANVGDALKRIPGITIQNDQGEARFGLVRGTAAQLNSVTVNGDRIPSAEAETRVVQLDLIPSDMISQIEVNKVLTPDMDADAIGGSINLVTRPPSKRRISATLGTNYNFLTGDPALTGSFIFGDRFMDDKMGLVVSGSIFDHFLGSDNIEGEWTQDDDGNAYMAEMDIRTYILRRVRRSVSLGWDYKITDNNTLFFNTIYNWRDDWENRYRLRYTDIEQNLDDNDVWDGTYSTQVRRQTKGGIEGGRPNLARLEDQRTFNIAFGGDHLFGDILKMDWRANYALASEDRPNERYISIRKEDVMINQNLSDTEFPLISSITAGELNDVGSFEFREITEEHQFTQDADFNARIDFELPLLTGKTSLDLKFGGRLRTKTKERENDFFEYEPTDEDGFMAQLEFEDQSKDDYLAGDEYDAGNFITREQLGGLDLKNASQFEETDALGEYIGGNFDATETIIGGYVMGTLGWKKLTVLGGIRVESTTNDYNANQFNEDTEEFNPISATSDYVNVLPNLQFKYDFTNRFNLRAAFTQSMARPNYFDLAPYQIIIEEDLELEIGNEDLEPAVSTNFDLMAEYYFQGIGILSGGVFHKNIKDFVYTYNQDDYTYNGEAGWEFTQPRNGAEGTLTGFEIALQRQLDFLPSFLSNLNVYFNYTYTTSEAGDLAGRDGESLALPGTAENMFNASLSYEDDIIIARVAVNYASDYIDELGDEAFEDRYYDEQLFVDANASVKLWKSLRFFIEANNLTNQPLRYYQGTQSRMMQLEYYNSRIHTGFKYDF